MLLPRLYLFFAKFCSVVINICNAKSHKQKGLLLMSVFCQDFIHHRIFTKSCSEKTLPVCIPLHELVCMKYSSHMQKMTIDGQFQQK